VALTDAATSAFVNQENHLISATSPLLGSTLSETRIPSVARRRSRLKYGISPIRFANEQSSRPAAAIVSVILACIFPFL